MPSLRSIHLIHFRSRADGQIFQRKNETVAVRMWLRPQQTLLQHTDYGVADPKLRKPGVSGKKVWKESLKSHSLNNRKWTNGVPRSLSLVTPEQTCKASQEKTEGGKTLMAEVASEVFFFIVACEWVLKQLLGNPFTPSCPSFKYESGVLRTTSTRCSAIQRRWFPKRVPRSRHFEHPNSKFHRGIPNRTFWA